MEEDPRVGENQDSRAEKEARQPRSGVFSGGKLIDRD